MNLCLIFGHKHSMHLMQLELHPFHFFMPMFPVVEAVVNCGDTKCTRCGNGRDYEYHWGSPSEKKIDFFYCVRCYEKCPIIN